MKTFEVYKVAEDGGRTLVVSIQADYYVNELSGASFFKRGFFGNRAIGFVEGLAYGGVIVADTEFLFKLPATEALTQPTRFLDSFKDVVNPIPEPQPPKRRRKNSLLNLD